MFEHHVAPSLGQLRFRRKRHEVAEMWSGGNWLVWTALS
jgi:hypothetical protein